MPLRTYLIFLTLAALLPVALFAGAVGYLVMAEQRDTFRRGAEARTLAVSTAVDVELNGIITALHALSTSPAFDRGDLASVRDRATRIMLSQSHWSNINVALPSGQQVMNLQRPAGAPLPNIADFDPHWPRWIESRQPSVANLVVGPITQEWDYAVRVPVIRDGSVKYVVSAVLRPESLSRLLAAQQLPADWVGVVLDQNHRIVARTVDPSASLGRHASQSLRDALARAASGWFSGSTIEGVAVYTPYHTSPSTGWVFAMGIPERVVDAAWWHAAWLLGGGLLAAVALAFALARMVSRRIAGPIAALAAATGTLARGEKISLATGMRIQEVRAVALALEGCAVAIRERQELVEREKQALQAADRAKDEFLAMLGHELRNPLAALTAAAHVLRIASSSPGVLRDAHAAIARQTRNMARMIEELLDISRITMGKVALELETLDLARVVSNVVETWLGSGRLDGRKIVLETSPAWIDADRGRMEQIVSNLLDNAVKFTPPGKGMAVSVRLEASDAVLRVADEGEGIAPEMLGAVFDLFAQAPHGSARSRGGLGIGLALVKRLAALHGGAVSAASDGLGQGAQFTMRLPAAASQRGGNHRPPGNETGFRVYP